MTRLKKELEKRSIIYNPNEYLVGMGPEYDEDADLVDISGDFLITVVYSAVLDPILRLYDRRTLEPVGEQCLYPERMLLGDTHTWMSHGYIEG